MKIVQLKSENVLNLKAIEIAPNGNAIVLTGKNGAGKSAVLDSIFFALTGKKVDELIRNGQNRAEVFVDIGDYKIKRVLTEKTERLEVTGKDGAAYKSPQTLLNKIVGDLSFDPLAFKNLKDKEQRDLLAKIVGLDFTILNKNREGLYTDRTIAGREKAKWEASLQSQTKPEEGLPVSEISISDQMAVIEDLEKKQRVYDEHIARVNQIERGIEDNSRGISEIDAEIVRLQESRNTMLSDTETLRKTLISLSAPEKITDEDMAQARAEISRIEAKNRAIRDSERYRVGKAEIAKAKATYDDLTRQINDIDAEKAEKTKSAQYPIAGLGMTDMAITYNGIPFKQLSTGQAIKVSAAIAMALNPELKIIMVRDASLLDENGMEAIESLATEKDYQLWIEKVDETGKVGIFIENGEIRTSDKQV